ncbi:Hypothetical protein GOX2242 [Gluconobacter oxydans 621H]|uniref:Uncharacterized protein n=1 Tax=Gluconobacter oxydans (strain 621H) TaxID=290633 RepID=Q5FNS1_GLUOX|nr:Hypothetical protein GOX2242 [Gluconobacter oxydans 621H]
MVAPSAPCLASTRPVRRRRVRQQPIRTSPGNTFPSSRTTTPSRLFSRSSDPQKGERDDRRPAPLFFYELMRLFIFRTTGPSPSKMACPIRKWPIFSSASPVRSAIAPTLS